MKRCSTLLLIREMQTKTTMRYHLTCVRMWGHHQKSAKNKCCRGSREKESSYTVGGNVNWCSHYGKQYGWSLKAKNRATIRFHIPLLGIYLEKTLIQNDAFTPVFTAAIFATAKTWKQPKFPSINEWINNM